MLSDLTTALRQHGLHVTAQRLAVLRVVHANPHITAGGVADAVRGEIGSISQQSVYDTLAVLSDTGLIRRIQPAGSAARYEGRVADNHHHLVCRRCDRVVDVDCAVGEPPCLTPAEDHDFALDEAEVVFWGLCGDCRAEAA